MLFAMMGIMLWCTTIFYPRYKQPASNATIAWDAAGYYWYLPSIFIYHDLGKQNWADSIIKKYGPGPEDIGGFGFRVDNGNVVMKYPAGMALAEMPFFLVSHVLAKPSGYPADGFSLPYQLAIQFGALFVAFIGLWYFRRLLLIYYTDGIVARCLFVLVAGTNYLNYSAIDGSIAHCWLFTLYVMLMLCSRSFYIRPSIAKALAIGSLCGLATLIRPTDIIACIIPLLWGLDGFSLVKIKARFAFLSRKRTMLLVAIMSAACIIAIQLLYWKVVAGHWFVYSYQHQGFSWLGPHVLEYTFSYRSGWIIYTPVMLFAILGFFPFMYNGSNRVMVIVFSALAFYFVTAWDIWWYAGTGGRAMIQYYPVLFFPLATFFEWIRLYPKRRIIGTPILMLFVYINIWFTFQTHRGQLYDADGGMTKEYYWRVVGRWYANNQTEKLKDGKYLYEKPLPAGARLLYSNALHFKSATRYDSMLTMDTLRTVSPDYSFAFHNRNGGWLRAEATFQCDDKEKIVWHMTQFCLAIWRGGIRQRETMVRIQRFMKDAQKKAIYVDLKFPSTLDADSIKVHFWNPGSKNPVHIENLNVWEF